MVHLDDVLLSIGSVWVILHNAVVFTRGFVSIFTVAIPNAGVLPTNMTLLAVGYTPLLLCAAFRPRHRYMYLREIVILFGAYFIGAMTVWFLRDELLEIARHERTLLFFQQGLQERTSVPGLLLRIVSTIHGLMEPMVYAYLDLFSHK